MKRGFDIVASAIGLCLLWPVVLICIVAIRLDSPGPGIFVQTRVGRFTRPFQCYKLRTMRNGTPNVATHLAPSSEVTSVGRWLRRTKLDELPQLWNVLAGQMSLVGPRPCLFNQTELVSERDVRGVMALRPGVTGLAQVNGIDMSDPARLATIDADYLRRQSFWLDLKIILATLFGRRV